MLVAASDLPPDGQPNLTPGVAAKAHCLISACCP